MAIKLLLQSMKVSTGSPITKMLLIQLAEKANAQGMSFHSHDSLARHCEVSIRTIQRHIQILCDKGLLTHVNRFDEHGVQSSNRYQLNLESLASSDTGVTESREVAHKKGGDDDRVTDITLTSNINNRSTELNHTVGHSDAVVITLLSSEGEVGLCSDFVEPLSQAYPLLDISEQLEAIRKWLILHPEKRKSPSSLRYFVNNWLYRSQRAQESHLKTSKRRRNKPHQGYLSMSVTHDESIRAPKPITALPQTSFEKALEAYQKRETKNPIEDRIAAIINKG